MSMLYPDWLFKLEVEFLRCLRKSVTGTLLGTTNRYLPKVLVVFLQWTIQYPVTITRKGWTTHFAIPGHVGNYLYIVKQEDIFEPNHHLQDPIYHGQ